MKVKLIILQFMHSSLELNWCFTASDLLFDMLSDYSQIQSLYTFGFGY